MRRSLPILAAFLFSTRLVLGQADFRRGDANVDGKVDIADAAFIHNHLFLRGRPSTCVEAENVNDDDNISLSDYVECLLPYLFGTSASCRAALPLPGPETPGPDPTPPNLPCESYDPQPAPHLARFILGFECPALVPERPVPGKPTVVYATLTTSENRLAKGAEGWSISIAAEGLKVLSITARGTAADAASLNEYREVVSGGRGAVTALLLSLVDQPVFLPADGTVRIAAITVEADSPAGGRARLSYVDGNRGSGQPVPNVIVLDGTSQAPVLGSCEMDVRTDCNANQVPDDQDLSSATSQDCNGNAVPDECDLSSAEVRFEPAGTVASGSGSIAAGDLDGDRHPDLAVGIPGGVSVLLQQDDGTFSPTVDYPVSPGPRALAMGYLDGDEDVDVAVLHSSGVAVLLNQGGGTLAAPVNYPAGDLPQSLAIADVDRDGDSDFAVANANSKDVSILRNRGDGTFEAPENYNVGGLVMAVAAADLDGDHSLDLAVETIPNFPAELSATVAVLHNQGDGTFASAGAFDDGSGFAESMIAGDLDGDQDPDLVIGKGTVLVNLGEGTFAAPTFYAAQSAGSLALGDVDGDGDLDLAVPGSVLLNQGDGTFTTPLRYGVGWAVALADLDGDDDLDLAVVAAGSGVSLLHNVSVRPRSQDGDRSGIPDECELPPRPRFHRADPNSSGTTDLSDAIAIFGYLFLGDPATFPCLESADTNNDGIIDISDGIYLLSWLFTGGPEPAGPGPTDRPCGFDPDPEGSAGDLGCESYACN